MSEAATTCCEGAVSGESSEDRAAGPSCAMASACRDFTESPGARYGFMVLGPLFILLGVAILLKPSLLVWLAGGSTILLGLLVLAGGFAVRKFSARLECCEPG